MKSDHEPHFESDLSIPPTLAEDLGRLTDHRVLVTSDVDDRVLDDARAHLQSAKPDRMKPNWWVAGAVAAAALVLSGSVLIPSWFAIQRQSQIDHYVLASDVNRDGSVNIVDAMVLARRVNDGATIAKYHDVNADGAIDLADANAIAMHTVSLAAWRESEGF